MVHQPKGYVKTPHGFRAGVYVKGKFISLGMFNDETRASQTFNKFKLNQEFKNYLVYRKNPLCRLGK